MLNGNESLPDSAGPGGVNKFPHREFGDTFQETQTWRGFSSFANATIESVYFLCRTGEFLDSSRAADDQVTAKLTFP